MAVQSSGSLGRATIARISVPGFYRKHTFPAQLGQIFMPMLWQFDDASPSHMLATNVLRDVVLSGVQGGQEDSHGVVQRLLKVLLLATISSSSPGSSRCASRVRISCSIGEGPQVPSLAVVLEEGLGAAASVSLLAAILEEGLAEAASPCLLFLLTCPEAG